LGDGSSPVGIVRFSTTDFASFQSNPISFIACCHNNINNNNNNNNKQICIALSGRNFGGAGLWSGYIWHGFCATVCTRVAWYRSIAQVRTVNWWIDSHDSLQSFTLLSACHLSIQWLPSYKQNGKTTDSVKELFKLSSIYRVAWLRVQELRQHQATGHRKSKSCNFYLAMLCMRGTSHWLVSVCLSVRLSQAGVLLKRINVGSQKQHRTIAQGLLFSVAKDLPKFYRGHPVGGRQMQVGWVKISDFRQITGCISKTVKDWHILSIKVK